MSARIIDGKALATNLRAEVAREVSEKIHAGSSLAPGLAVVLVGNDPASEVYVRSKSRAAQELGIQVFEYKHSESISEADLIDLIRMLNARDDVDGILVQLPLPPSINQNRLLWHIDPQKDVDGFHPENAGRLAAGVPRFVPCTPLGCLHLLRSEKQTLPGKNAVVIGRSMIVGRPMAQLLINEHCSVTVVHSRSEDIASVVRRADIVVSAIGRPRQVTADWIKPGAIVIDVGINRVSATDGSTSLVGDVDWKSVSQVAGAVSPVPGGVGPMTIACLMSNTVRAATLRRLR